MLAVHWETVRMLFSGQDSIFSSIPEIWALQYAQASELSSFPARLAGGAEQQQLIVAP